MDLPIKVMTFGTQKGFLRNKQKLEMLQKQMNDPENKEADNAMTEFVLMYTVFPADKAKAKELILDLSQNELNHAINLISGEPEVPKASGETSADSTLRASEPLPSGQ